MNSEATTTGEAEATHQEHPLGVYFKIWLLLFVLSACSYAVDYVQLQGMLRWTLILIFMFLKAGFIIAIFMHMIWERMALATAILLPPCVLILLIAFMAIESNYTNGTRVDYMGQENLPQVSWHHGENHGGAEQHGDSEEEAAQH